MTRFALAHPIFLPVGLRHQLTGWEHSCLDSFIVDPDYSDVRLEKDLLSFANKHTLCQQHPEFCRPLFNLSAIFSKATKKLSTSDLLQFGARWMFLAKSKPPGQALVEDSREFWLLLNSSSSLFISLSCSSSFSVSVNSNFFFCANCNSS